MKYYFYGWLAMIVVVGGLGMADYFLYNRTRLVRVEDAQLNADAETYRMKAEAAEAMYKALWKQNENASAFLAVWKAHLSRGGSVSDMVALLSQLAQEVARGEKQALSFEISQIVRVTDYPLLVDATVPEVPRLGPAATSSSTTAGGQPIAAQSYACVVRGPYHLVMNWLGKVEEMFPAAKVDQTKMSVQSNAISLSLVLMFPEIEVGELVTPLALSE